MGPKRFVIITVPPEETAGEICRVREEVCRIADSRAALAYPPHITLRTGALVPEPEIEGFIEGFGRGLGSFEPFAIHTDGLLMDTYDAGQTKYFVGYRVIKDEPLAALNQQLLRYEPYRKSNRLHFHPHLTLAFDDLSLEGFRRVKDRIESGDLKLPEGFSWICDNVGLYHLVDGLWEPYHVYSASATAAADNDR